MSDKHNLRATFVPSAERRRVFDRAPAQILEERAEQQGITIQEMSEMERKRIEQKLAEIAARPPRPHNPYKSPVVVFSIIPIIIGLIYTYKDKNQTKFIILSILLVFVVTFAWMIDYIFAMLLMSFM